MWREVFKNLKISVYEFSLLTALARYQNYILNHLIMVIFRKNWDRKLGRENKKLQVTILLIVGALTSLDLNPIQDGLFRGCLRMGEEGGGKKAPLPKICYTYPTMMKLGTVIPYRTHHLSSPNISTFSLKINKFCYIKIYRYKLHFNT